MSYVLWSNISAISLAITDQMLAYTPSFYKLFDIVLYIKVERINY